MKRPGIIFLALLLLGLCASSSFAQSKALDSIYASLVDPDANVDALLDEAAKQDFPDRSIPDSTLRQIISIATRLNDRRMFEHTKSFTRQIRRKTHHRDHQAESWISFLDQEVLAYGHSNQWDTCRLRLEEGIELINQYDLHDSFPQFYANMGFAKIRMGESPINDYLYALALATRKNDIELQISTLENLARAYRAEGDNATSIEYSLKAFDLAVAHHISVRAYQVVNLAEVYGNNHDLDKAIDLYTNYEPRIADDPREKRIFYFGWGELYIYKIQDYEKGMQYTRQALEYSSGFRTAKLLANQAFVHAMQDRYALALTWQQKAIEEYHDSGWPLDPAHELLVPGKGIGQFWYIYRYAQILFLKNARSHQPDPTELEEAAKLNRTALEMLLYFQSRLSIGEQSRFSDYVRKCTTLGVEIQYLILQSGMDARNLIRFIDFVDMEKSMKSLSKEKKAELGRSDTLLARLFDREDQAYSELFALKMKSGHTDPDHKHREVQGKLEDIRKIKKAIAREAPPLHGYSHDNIDLADLKKNLKPDEVILNYFLSDYVYGEYPNGLFITVITPDTVMLTKRITSDHLQVDIDSLLQQIINKSEHLGSTIERISDQLLARVELYIKGKKLIIVPDRHLNRIPFDLLEGSSGQPLADTHEWRIIPSLSILSRELVIRSGNQVFALAPEGHVSPGLLRGALDEIEFLRTRFKGYYPPWSEAGESSFKKHASQYGVIHLATHAVINELYPEESYFYFPHDTSGLEDGRLHTEEINYMRIPATLTFLGACSTGAGKLYGDGVMSLASSFIRAGSQNVIHSLWPLDDQTTAILVQFFYQNLHTGLPPGAALRKAKSDFRLSVPGDIRHPYYWAGLTLTGLYDVPLIIETIDSEFYITRLLLALGLLFLLVTALIILRRIFL